MTKEFFKNEILSEEQLDLVAGGTVVEFSIDTQILHALGMLNRSYGIKESNENLAAVKSEVNNELRKFGFQMFANADGTNENTYYVPYNGGVRLTTRSEFFKTACAAMGNPDFDYRSMF